MPTESSARPQGFPQPGNTGHETRDASVGWIFGVVLFLAICAFTMHLVLAGLLNGFKHRKAPTDFWNPVQRAAVPSLGQYPKLQVNPVVDLNAFRAREEAELNSYGWVNQTAGIVHVPIERAMELVLQKGLPERNRGNQAETGPSTLQLQQQRPAQPDPDNGGQR